MRQAPVSLPLGIVIRRTPSVSRWAKWSWQAVGVLPGAAQAEWQVLRTEGEAVEFHAATVPLELWRTDTEAYLNGLSARTPSIGVILRECSDPDAPVPYDVVLATASPYEFQDYADSGEEIVELVPMPEGLVALIRDFVEEHHEEEVFVKRRRDKKRIDLVEEGRGDARISQLTDVYRAPRRGEDELSRSQGHKAEGFWARRKAAVAVEAETDLRDVEQAELAQTHAALEEKSDADILVELELPDPDTLEKGDDFSVFLAKAVPERIRRRALRKLWLSNPILANVDNLVDYGEDFTDSAMVIEGMQTTYQVGKGMLRHIEEMARQAEAAEAKAAEADHPDAEEETEPHEDDMEPQEQLVAQQPISPATPEITSIDPDPAAVSLRRMRFSFDDGPGTTPKDMT